MNERKPTWNCPVCDSKALYDTLLIDGYFQEVLQSSTLSKDENDIILESDGSWKPVPKDDEKTKPPSSLPPTADNTPSAPDGTANKKKDDEVECIDLSDDEVLPPLPPGPPPPPPALTNNGGLLPPGLPPLPSYAQVVAPPPPPMQPQEIECIDLD